ncbi:hypothetical protein KP79_PYT17069 [Mizuhopecten yessoensis]|uniref:Uncharacterized protein n=1 Tax=Mizuhopecten yessoensis TaxID=6573 RepID=A0A210R2E6_MIZYE|nr:hypothetical protein KP79_PYT17069 [Mizuhopecten yessoensis]
MTHNRPLDFLDILYKVGFSCFFTNSLGRTSKLHQYLRNSISTSVKMLRQLCMLLLLVLYLSAASALYIRYRIPTYYRRINYGYRYHDLDDDVNYIISTS